MEVVLFVYYCSGVVICLSIVELKTLQMRCYCTNNMASYLNTNIFIWETIYFTEKTLEVLNESKMLIIKHATPNLK